VFIITGVAWIARGIVAMAAPDYYAPVTAIDYAAVGLFSLALMIAAAALALLRRSAARVHRAARAALLGAAIGGIVAGVANFGEDWLGLSLLTWVYIGGVLVFYFGMGAAGVALIARNRDLRWIGALLIVPLPAGLLGQAAGFIIGGIAFIACAALLARSHATDRVLS